MSATNVEPVMDDLYQRANQRLDRVLNALRLDIAERALEPDGMPDGASWLFTQRWVKDGIESGELKVGFLAHLLTTALYRLAKS